MTPSLCLVSWPVAPRNLQHVRRATPAAPPAPLLPARFPRSRSDRRSPRSPRFLRREPGRARCLPPHSGRCGGRHRARPGSRRRNRGDRGDLRSDRERGNRAGRSGAGGAAGVARRTCWRLRGATGQLTRQREGVMGAWEVRGPTRGVCKSWRDIYPELAAQVTKIVAPKGRGIAWEGMEIWAYRDRPKNIFDVLNANVARIPDREAY